jgi:hypothetical protein
MSVEIAETEALDPETKNYLAARETGVNRFGVNPAIGVSKAP